MKNVYVPNVGETAKIVTSMIKRNLKDETTKKNPNINTKKKIKNKIARTEERPTRIEKLKKGKFSKSDLKYLIRGCDFLRIVGDAGIETIISYFSTHNEKMDAKTAKAIIGLKACKGPIYDFLKMYTRNIQEEYNLQREMANLDTMYEIIDKSRDGVITRKQEIEDSNGQKTEIEIAMSETEIADIIRDYTNQLYRIQDNTTTNYLGLGMSIISMLGAMLGESKTSKEMAKKIGISGLVSVGTLIGRRYVTKNYGEKVGEKRRKVARQEGDLIRNEPVSVKEAEKKKEEIKEEIRKVYTEDGKIQNKVDIMNAIDIISSAILTGMIGSQKMKDSQKLDAKTLSQIIVETNRMSYLIGNVVHNVDNIFKLMREKNNLRASEKQLEDIIKQIEEKQDPLIETTKPFESIEIRDFKGKFYPEEDPNTGKMRYRHKIEVPEFSIKKGEVVLLSGKSGKGKSTFLKLLKRGDINNRQVIQIDGEEKVDKLGKQFIAIKADKDLGMNGNVLKELVGKESVSDISEEEMQKLQTVLKDVCLDKEGILQELTTKDYSQFSTGQKKRLVLAQILYRASEKPSIILVDEPVENVEDGLIDNQLNAITQVIKNVGSMGIIVTHRVDLASRYVDKHYHIGDDGVMREISKEEKNLERTED